MVRASATGSADCLYPLQVRGATYLKDKKKVPAGLPAFSLGAVEMIRLPSPGTTVGRERRGEAATRGSASASPSRAGAGSCRSSSSGGGDLPGTPGECVAGGPARSGGGGRAYSPLAAPALSRQQLPGDMLAPVAT